MYMAKAFAMTRADLQLRRRRFLFELGILCKDDRQHESWRSDVRYKVEINGKETFLFYEMREMCLVAAGGARRRRGCVTQMIKLKQGRTKSIPHFLPHIILQDGILSVFLCIQKRRKTVVFSTNLHHGKCFEQVQVLFPAPSKKAL